MKSEWRPIESAPTDGRYVLIYNALGSMHVARWGRRYLGDTGNEAWVCDRKYVARPTHWMELPDAPIMEGGD